MELLGGGVLGDGFSTLAHGVLGQLSGQQQTNCCLNFPTGDGSALVVLRQSGRFGGDPFEDVVDEAVHDGHGFAGNAGVRVDLLHHLVDVDAVTLLAATTAFLVTSARSFLGLGGLLRSLSRWFRRHVQVSIV